MAERTSEELKLAFGSGEYPSSTDYADLVDTLFAGVGSSGGSYTVSETAPLNPSAGDIWFNSVEATTLLYYEDADSSQWIEVSGGNRGLPGYGIPSGGTSGQYLAKNSNTDYDFSWITVDLTTLNALTDVDTSTVVDGQALIYDQASNTWIPGEGGASVTIDTVAPTAPEVGDLWFDSSTGKTYVYYSSSWVEIAANSIGYFDLGQLNDVSVATATDGQALLYDAATSTWIPGDAGISVTGAVADDFLRYNGADWVADAYTDPIKLNGNTISADYTIPTGYNGLTAGPVTIADGVTVTISDGSAWSIV